ncbi:MAG: FtsX-like permease family protein [Bacteroidaceae bacterium]|nr:FtsX-like permease family protein [Bacteroidaceae bacterium]
MNFPLFISRRYLFSKKSTHAINLISLVSMLGVAVATMALIVTMSVFNGFHDLVATLFTSFDPQVQITPAKGKSMPVDDEKLLKVKKLEAVEVATEVVTEKALAAYKGKQAMVTVMGVEDNFNKLTNINSILYGDGDFTLQAANLEFGILGIRLADALGASAHYSDYLQLYAPQREGQLIDLEDPSEAFVVDSVLSPGVIFSVQQAKYDKSHIITSIDFARNLFGMQNMMSALDLRLKPGSDIDAVKKEIKQTLGEGYVIKDRYEQQAETFNIMEIEKLLAYVFLSFILIVASFNIIGSLSMLMIDKKEDTETLRKLGAKDKQIAKIFLYEGRMIACIGAIIGLLVGLLLCWLQQTFGLVALGQSEGTFIVNAYPVSVHPSDILIVFITVVVVSWIATWYPVRYFSKKSEK